MIVLSKNAEAKNQNGECVVFWQQDTVTEHQRKLILASEDALAAEDAAMEDARRLVLPFYWQRRINLRGQRLKAESDINMYASHSFSWQYLHDPKSDENGLTESTIIKKPMTFSL